MNKHKKIFGFAIVALVIALSGILTHSVRSTPLENVTGFAWGARLDQSNGQVGGLGWLSFNSTNDHDPDVVGVQPSSVGYGVNIDPPTGNMTGWAWSSNYGWLKFGELAGQLVGPGIISTDAKLVGNNLTGWARFCAPANDQSACTGFTSNTTNGGWDGWVRLSGTTIGGQTYGVNLDPLTGKFSGYAWGGNDGGRNNVGWINFATDFSDVIYVPVTGPVVSLSANPTSVPTGGTTTLSWQGQNLGFGGLAGCQASVSPVPPGDTWTGIQDMPTGPLDVQTFQTNTLTQNGTYVYSISCPGPSGIMSPPSNVTVVVGVQLDFWAEPNPVYPDTDLAPPDNSYMTTLYWQVVPSNGVLTNCDGTSNTPGEITWNNAIVNPPNPSASLGGVYVPAQTTEFTITCLNSLGGIVDATINVHRNELPEGVVLNHSSTTCLGGSCTTTLDWKVTNGNGQACTASSISPPGFPPTNWTGPITQLPVGNQPGVQVPNSAEFTLYTLSCTGISGNSISGTTKVNNVSGASSPPKYFEN